jgi:restriction system protein
MRKRTGSGPRFVRYLGPLVEVLRDLGGSAKPAEAYQGIVTKMRLTDETLSETMASGQPRFDNQVAWARFYLVKAGIIDASSRGVWTLTEKGRQLGRLTQDDALHLFKEVHARFQGVEKDSCADENEETTAAPPEGGLPPSAGTYRQLILERLRGWPRLVSSDSRKGCCVNLISKR